MRKGYRSLSETKRERAKKIKVFIISFVIFTAVLLMAVSLRLIGKIQTPTQTTVPQTSQGESTSQRSEYLTGFYRFIGACAGTDGKIIISVYVEVNLDEGTFTAFALDPSDMVISNGKNTTLTELYARGGIRSFAEGAAKCYGLTYDRYLGFTEKGFSSFVRNLGKTTVYVDEDIYYIYENVSLQLQQGLQKLSYDDLVNYIKYAKNGEEALRLQAEVTADMLESFLIIDNISQGENLFSVLINLTDSNITAADNLKAQPVLEAVAADKNILYGSGGVLEPVAEVTNAG